MTCFRNVRVFALIGVGCICVGLLGCGQPQQAHRPINDDKAPGVGVTAHQVVFQQPAEAPAEELSGSGGAQKWAMESFDALKQKGLTTANNASGWLSEDFKNMSAWEYKVKHIDVSNGDAAESALNKMGSEQWECFHVQGTGSRLTFFFKKEKRSYLRSLPTSELMRLVPLMGGE